ncbi:uncharacterized protein J7T54_002746, partial [Emericellopsis cladophorae]
MRFINCHSYDLETFELSEAPPFAILSHTWGGGEVTFDNLRQPGNRAGPGWEKIERTCRQALKDGWGYAWVDTCCIDKSSSAELSESINSMFKWYLHAEVCYVFLADYTHSGDEDTQEGGISGSRWFTRGWTLQELIAPSRMEFYDKDWQHIGSKGSLGSCLSKATGIDEEILRVSSQDSVRARLDACTIAQRMSWAASRTTKREEDMAYCLLGIFGINMPMLYGEGGPRAFLRLQEEIVKESSDMTIFAWQTSAQDPTCDFQEAQHQQSSHQEKTYHGVFAAKPSDFRYASRLTVPDDHRAQEYTMTNKGLKLSGGPELRAFGHDMFFLCLHCHHPDHPQRSCGIYLQSHGPEMFARVHPERLVLEPDCAYSSPAQIYISKHLRARELNALRVSQRRIIKFTFAYTPKIYRCKTLAVEPRNQWNPHEGHFMLTPGQASFTGFYRVSWHRNELQKGNSPNRMTDGEFIVLCGYKKASGPWACVIAPDFDGALYRVTTSMDLKLAGELGSRMKYNTTTPLKNQSRTTVIKLEEEVAADERLLAVVKIDVNVGTFKDAR